MSNEIHGYEPEIGLQLFTEEVLAGWLESDGVNHS